MPILGEPNRKLSYLDSDYNRSESGRGGAVSDLKSKSIELYDEETPQDEINLFDEIDEKQHKAFGGSAVMDYELELALDDPIPSSGRNPNHSHNFPGHELTKRTNEISPILKSTSNKLI